MTDSQPRKRINQFPGNELTAIVNISRIKSTIGQNGTAVNILYGRSFLTIVDSGAKDHLGMIINDRADIALNHTAVWPDRKLHDIFDVRLGQLHPVCLTEPTVGTLPGFGILFHLLFTESGFVQITLHSRALQNPRGDQTFHLKDQDDLVDRTGRDFSFQLDCLPDQFIKVFRKSLRPALFTVHRFQA